MHGIHSCIVERRFGSKGGIWRRSYGMVDTELAAGAHHSASVGGNAYHACIPVGYCAYHYSWEVTAYWGQPCRLPAGGGGW